MPDAAPSSDDIRTPVTVLTGFLGSGKTTLLNKLLEQPSMARTLVVINEFGEVPLDHALTASSDDSIVVLENGCLCCTVFGDLVETLNDLYHRREQGRIQPFEKLIIETSGLADPTSVLQAFLSDPTLAGLYRVRAVITTLDAVNGPGTLDEFEEAVRQVALADQILITKLDMLGAEAAAAEASLRRRLQRLNPAAVISRTGDDGFEDFLQGAGWEPTRSPEDLRRWLNLEAYGADEAAGHVHDETCGHGHGACAHAHSHDDAIASFSLVRDQPTTRAALELLLAAIERTLGPNLLRVKGLVNVLEDPDRPALIQGAQHLLHNAVWLDRWPDADRRTRIVFITKDMPRAELEEMVTLLDRVAVRTSTARLRGAGLQ